MTDLATKIKIMQAALDGKEVEYLDTRYTTEWAGYKNTEPSWRWNDFDYRIKPEPMELWVNVWSDRETNLCWESKENAEAAAHGVPGYIKSVKFREVIE